MGRTFTQVRQRTAKETGFGLITGTSDTGGSVTILRDAALTRYADNRLVGQHILLTSGNPTFTELLITQSFELDGDALFRPEIAAAPDSLTYEILPFSGTSFLFAIQKAILELYDSGYLSRDFWMRMMGGSPVYNADWSYWTGTNTVDGWTASNTTLTRERASENLAMGETSVALTNAGTLGLNAQYQRYLFDLKESSLTLYCWVKTSAASNARLNLNTGSNNYSAYHGGDGDWELLSVNVSTADTDTALQPILVTDTSTVAYFGMPWLSGAPRIMVYPFPHQVMPDGPNEVISTSLGVDESVIASGRGLGDLRQTGHGRVLLDPRMLKHHDENASNQVGILDFTLSSRPPVSRQAMWLRGDGPLTVPTSATSTDILEITETEELLLGRVAAVKLLEEAKAGSPSSVRRLFQSRIDELAPQIETLMLGIGESRDVATYSLGW